MYTHWCAGALHLLAYKCNPLIVKEFIFRVKENLLLAKLFSFCILQISFPGESIGLKFISSQSELFRFIPISVFKPMRIIPNQYEKRFVFCLMKNDQKSIRLNPINSETLIRINPKPSFQSKSIRAWIGPNQIFN